MTDRLAFLRRESHTLLATASVVVLGYLLVGDMAPEMTPDSLLVWVEGYIGPTWPFFAGVVLLLLYATGALLAGLGDRGAGRRDWTALAYALHWATEASPLVGLLQTFMSLAVALGAFAEAGPGAESQSAFIAQFSTALGSTIAGGALSLGCFTLHKLVMR